MRPLFSVVAAALIVAACATPKPLPQPEPLPSEPEAAVTPEPEKSEMETRPLKYLVNRKIAPQPTRPLNIKSGCSFADEVGTRGRLDLQVKNGEVKKFSTVVNMPKHGACRFRLDQFHQAASLPNVLLQASNGSGCTVRMWEQGPKTMVAFNSCPDFCDGQAFDYLWPILVETRTGRCY